jgi:hypothetical protein
MTEAEWLACTDPDKMLALLRGKASDRKLRYFLAACARRVLPDSADEAMLEAVAVAERFAEGAESRPRLTRARSSLQTRHPARVSRWSPLYSAHLRSVPAWHMTREQVFQAAREGARGCAWSSTRTTALGGYVARTFPEDERAAQAFLLRDSFGNPFRAPPTIEPAVLAGNDGTVVKAAQASYDERRWDDLRILADALDDAGCNDEEVLAHGRAPAKVPVGGCWAIDWLLGKE